MTAACGRRTEMAKKVKIKSKKPQGIGSKIFDVVNYLLLAILGFIMFYPMFYVFIVSISSSQYINQGLVTLFPRGINFDAYKAVFENQRIWSGYKNTFLYTGLGTPDLPGTYRIVRLSSFQKRFLRKKGIYRADHDHNVCKRWYDPNLSGDQQASYDQYYVGYRSAARHQYLQYDCYENFLPGDPRFLGRICIPGRCERHYDFQQDCPAAV